MPHRCLRVSWIHADCLQYEQKRGDNITHRIRYAATRGHALVISKVSQARNLLEVEPEVLAELAAATQKLSKAVVSALKPDGVVVTQFNGAPAGQTIFHLHFHVIPRYEGEALGRHGEGGMANTDELKALAAKIAEAL